MWRFWILAFLAFPVLGTAQTKPSVILITLDTVRADRMGFLGSKRGLTPEIDALARQGVVFEETYSQAPLTPVSHATILSGTYPRYHGVRDFGSRLPESIPYLSESLLSSGYRTAAFVSSIILDPKNGFSPGFERGFEVYDAGFHRASRGEKRLGSIQRRGEQTVGRALEWVAKNKDAPIFLWVHIWDAHDPYEPPSPFRERYAGKLYDGCIAYVDATVGKLLAGLRRVGKYDDSIIAVMSDHGESLGEHGENTHGVFLYDSTISVPLAIKFPAAKFAGQRVKSRIGLVDVAPTLLAAANASVPAAMQGQSLLRLIESKGDEDRPSFAESEYSQRGFGWSSLESLRARKFLYINAPRPELYDRAADPGELHNIYGENKLASVRFAVQIEALSKKSGANAPESAKPGLDPQSVEKLAALGYVASSGPRANSSGIDPKDRIQVSNDLHDANLRIEEGQETIAIPLLEKVVASDPQIPHAQYFLGVAYKELRQFDKAIEHLRKAIELVPDSMMAQYEMAISLYEKGELQSSTTHFEIVVDHSPDWIDARYSMASVYARTGRPEEAAKNLLVVLQSEPDHYRANLLLGRMLFLNGSLAEALPYLEKAAQVQGDSREAHSFLADGYEKLGRAADAEKERAEAERLKRP